MRLINRNLFALLTLLFMLGLGTAGQAGMFGGDKPALEQQRSDAVDSAAAKVRDALVRIHVVNANYAGGRVMKSEASGSGVIISPDGYVVTNHHVAGDAIRLTVTMPNREELPAELIGTDPLSDIAVIKLKSDDPKARFPYATFGDSGALQVGDTVLAMGSPLALSQSVTEGIVSNMALTMPSMFSDQFELDGENVGSIVLWIGHDAAIFPGNSGGPLVNLQGQVIGINEISLGLGGAIPGDLARQVADTIIKAPEHEVARAWMGFLLQPVFKHDKEMQGVIVSDVIEGSPAAKAELRSGDRLLSVGERQVNVRFAEDLPPLNLFLASLPIGQPVQLVVERDGKQVKASLAPERREKVQSRQREFAQWGLTGRNLSIWTAIEMKRPNKDGLLVTSVNPGGSSGQAKPALQEDDILVRVAGEPIRNMNDLTSATERLTKGQEAPVPTLVTFVRDGQELMTVVDVGIDNLNDPGIEPIRAWVPVATQVLTRELAEQFKLGDKSGVRVTQVYDGPSTNTFGLKVGDIILAVEGEPIPASEPHEIEVFPTMIRLYPIGTRVTLTVMREGREEKLSAPLPRRPPQPREMKRYQDYDFDFTVRDVAYLDRMSFRWEDAPSGVLVDAVEPGGWAALARLSVGDLLMAIDDQPVASVEQVKGIMERIKQQKKNAVVFKVRRGVHDLFLELEPMWKLETAQAE